MSLLLLAGTALGLPAVADHNGHVKGDPQGFVAFTVTHTHPGRRVRDFTVSNVAYTCSSGEPPDRTGGLRFEHGMRVRNGSFEGVGDWQALAFDPRGRISGTLRRNGNAVGSFRIHGDFAGPGSHCQTGLLEWRAARQPPQA